MTVPVSTWVSLTSDGKEEFRDMAFFLGQDQQEKPLKPTNDKVYLRERPGVTVFTRFVWTSLIRPKYEMSEDSEPMSFAVKC